MAVLETADSTAFPPEQTLSGVAVTLNESVHDLTVKRPLPVKLCPSGFVIVIFFNPAGEPIVLIFNVTVVALI